MFSKLLKHEWKANAGLMGVLSLAAAGVGILGTIALRVLINYGDRIAESDSVFVLLLFPLVLLVGGAFLSLVVYAAAVSFVLLFRFYKNKFTDEGYLTFTLPVKTHYIFLSSALNMVIWMVISMVLVVLLFSVMILCGTATQGLINQDIINNFDSIEMVWKGVSSILGEIVGDGYGIIMLLTLIITPIFSVVLSMTCITLVAVVAKKHKILAAIGISYGASIVLSIISSVVTSLPSFLLLGKPNPGMEDFQVFYTISGVLQLVIYVGVIVGGYFLSTSLMKNKLNLP